MACKNSKNSPSGNHNNRGPHNWLLYECFDKMLIEIRAHLKGDILDLGCGNKPYEAYFNSLATSYIGVDWSESRHDTRADIIADLNKPLPLDDEIADTIISISVLEHLSEPWIMVNECHRLLRRNGHLIIQVPWNWRVHEEPHDYYRFTQFGLKHILAKAGFVDIRVVPHAGFFSMLSLKTNYFSRKLIRGPNAIQLCIQATLIPLWYISQKAAKVLDRLDRDWMADGPGFYAIATKKQHP